MHDSSLTALLLFSVFLNVISGQEDSSAPTTRAKNSDAYVLVYSIADRASFRAAQEALVALQTNNRQRFIEAKDPELISAEDSDAVPVVPVVLLGNKKDLSHLRQVGFQRQPIKAAKCLI